MPSPRAVLADITDLGLHPAEKHKVVGASGRLRVKVQSTIEPEKQDEVKLVEEDVAVTQIVAEPEVVIEASPVIVDQPRLQEKKLRKGKKQTNQ